MLSKIFRFVTHKRAAFFALLLSVLATIFFIVLPTALVLLCQDVLYSREYGTCTDMYEMFFRFIPSVLGAVAVSLMLSYLFRNRYSIKKLRYPLLGYTAFVVLILLPLSNQKYCLFFLGCTSLAPFALLLGFIVLIALVIAGVLADLFLLSGNGFKKVMFFLVAIFALTIGFYYLLSAPDNLKNFVYKRDLEDVARMEDNVAVCDQTLLHRHRDDCIESFSISKGDASYCEGINSQDIKEQCIAFVIRNKAIDTLDLSMCNEITIASQVSVCKSRIQENLRSQR